MEAIRLALTLPGLRGVEFDVELSDLPVVLHQETMVPDDAFSALVPATRDFVSRDWVSERSAKEICELDAGSYMGDKFTGVRVPQLSDVLGLDWNGREVFAELKDPTYWGERDLSRPQKVVEAVLPAFDSFSGHLNVISFNPAILSEIRSQRPKFPVTLALWTEWRGRAAEALDLAASCGASAVTLPDKLVLDDPGWVGQGHARGIEIHVYPVTPARGEPEFERWTADSQIEAWKRLAAVGVDAIVSDFPRETLSSLSL